MLFPEEASLLCMREWRVSSSEREKRFSQPEKVQTKGFSPVWVRMCLVWERLEKLGGYAGRTYLVLEAAEGPTTEGIGAFVGPGKGLVEEVDHGGMRKKSRGTAYKIVRGKGVGNPAW